MTKEEFNQVLESVKQGGPEVMAMFANDDFKQALESAKQGDTEAMVAVAMTYIAAAQKDPEAPGSRTNSNMALSWMQKAAACGHVETQEMLTGMFKEWSAAAEKGDIESLVQLSLAYLKGIGTDADYKQAVFWAKKANAAKGNVENKILAKASLEMAKAMLPAGNFRELMEGAQKGNVNLQYALGFAYLKGFGTDVNPDQAVFWFQKAAKKHVEARDALGRVQAILAVGGDNFDLITPKAKASTVKNQILSGVIVSAVLSYLATGLDIGWLYPVAIFFNISWMIYAAFFIIADLIIGIGRIMGLKGRNVGKAATVYGCFYMLLLIPIIALTVHYTRGRKTGNPVSIVLQNPFEAARERIFGAARASEPEIVEPPVVTATVTSSAANIRSEPDGSKNNVIIQARNGDTLIVTGPAERGWLPVEVDGKQGYVSSELVEINDN
jgi:uncharacterized protein YgiM (DUF1202 family)